MVGEPLNLEGPMWLGQKEGTLQQLFGYMDLVIMVQGSHSPLRSS